MTREQDLLNAVVVARNYIGESTAYKCGDVGAGATMRRLNDAIQRAEAYTRADKIREELQNDPTAYD